MTREQDDRVTGIVGREQWRLWNFIRRRVPDARDAEDILQDVFAELVEANRLLMPIDHARARRAARDPPAGAHLGGIRPATGYADGVIRDSPATSWRQRRVDSVDLLRGLVMNGW